MARIPKKTRDEIINANLRRMLAKLKARVAESEEIWLDMFETVLPLVIGDVDEVVGGAKDEWWKGKIARAASVTDDILTEYERRWGGGERKETEG